MSDPHLYLVRHAQTLHNGAKVLRGRQSAGDVLSPLGERQAQACAAQFAAWQAAGGLPDPRVYASTYLRAQQTARPIAAALGSGLTVLDGLHEMDIGDWRGRPYGDLHTHFAELRQLGGRIGFPGGEDTAQVAARGLAAIHAALDAGGTPIVVSHGLAIQVLLCALLRLDFAATWLSRRYDHENAAVTELRREVGERWTLVRLAETAWQDK